MLRRALNVLKYQLERLLLRGAYARLLVIAALIGLVSIIGGAALLALGGREDAPSAIWWAFLRLSDPGYLGDDHGNGRRVLSTVITVAGYVLFMGSLVAIMTQWLNQSIRSLESGLTPIAQRDHLVVIGWTSRTAVIAREMFESGARVRRFLSLYDARALRMVFLLEHLDAQIRHDLRQRVGSNWRERSVAMRSGSALHVQDLLRADVSHASAILIPAEDVGRSVGAADARTVKTLLSLRQHLGDARDEDMPLVVTELFDAQKLSIARRAYPGPLELVCSDQLIGRLLALTVLNPGLAEAFEDLLEYGRGNDVHIIEAPDIAGTTVAEIRGRLPFGILLGFVEPKARSFEPRLCPQNDDVMNSGERLVVLAASHEHAIPDAQPLREPAKNAVAVTRAPDPVEESVTETVLVMGWSDRVPDLAKELHAHHSGPVRIDVLSAVSVLERQQALADYEDLGKIEINLLEGNITRRAVVARHLARNYDRIVLVASDWLDTGAQSDARTVLAYMLVRDELARRKRSTPLVLELMDATNRALIRDENVEVLVSPLIIGQVLAHVTLRRELRTVYDDLFDSAGPAVRLRPVSFYGDIAEPQTFAQLSCIVEQRGDVLLGWMSASLPRHVTLNPDTESTWTGANDRDLVVLGRPGA